MNILFLGNCQILTAIRKLPVLLNQLPEKDLYIQMIYVAGGGTATLLKNFHNSMSEEFLKTKSHKGNRIWTYVYGNNRWHEVALPDVTICDVVKNTQWDIIITCDSTYGQLTYNNHKNDYIEYFKTIRMYSDAKLYWLSDLVSDKNTTKPHLYDNASGGTRDGMINYLNMVDESVCNEFNLEYIPMRQAFEHLVEKFPGYNDLIIDRIHPDRGIGEYFCTAYLYNFFFRSMYGVDLSALHYRYDASKHTYEGTDIQCISVDRKTKKIVDDIADFC